MKIKRLFLFVLICAILVGAVGAADVGLKINGEAPSEQPVLLEHGGSVTIGLDVAPNVDVVRIDIESKNNMVEQLLKEKLELLTDVQISINQIEDGQGIDHEDAKDRILKRVQK